MIALSTRSRCDECGNAPAVVQIDEVYFLCASCEAIVIDSVAPASSSPGVSAAASGIVPPIPSEVAAINFLDFEAEVTALEANGFARSGISKSVGA